MSQKRKSKEEIIAEYLSGDYTFRELGIKYNIPYRTIAGWVWAYQGRSISWREKMKRQREKQTGQPETELPKELNFAEGASQTTIAKQIVGRNHSNWRDGNGY